MGIKAFNTNKTTTEIVNESLTVGSDGSVSFRTNRGKGTGRPTTIPADQFDGFVAQMNDVAARRATLASKAASEVVTDSEVESE